MGLIISPMVYESTNQKRLFSGLSFQLQFAAAFLSLVGLGFGLKSYWHIEDVFGTEAARPFIADFYAQLMVALVANALVSWAIYRIATKPIRDLTRIMTALANNNTDVEVPMQERHNEIGSMARCIQVFRENAIAKHHLEAQQQVQAAANDEERRTLLTTLATQFQNSVGQVVAKFDDVSRTFSIAAEHLSKAAVTTGTEVAEANAGTQAVRANLSAVVAATEQLSRSIDEVHAKVQGTSRIVGEAISASQDARQRTASLSQAVTAIHESTKLIDGITSKTNLLAFNATIEASRAGEAGKGFAVVAAEVKALAAQTNTATVSIGAAIERIRAETEAVSSATASTDTVVKNIGELTEVIVGAMEQEAQATTEISSRMAEMANLADDLARRVDMVAIEAHHTQEVSTKVAQLVDTLQRETSTLETKSSTFVARLTESPAT